MKEVKIVRLSIQNLLRLLNRQILNKIQLYHILNTSYLDKVVNLKLWDNWTKIMLYFSTFISLSHCLVVFL